MMPHLTPDQFIDLAEGVRPESSLPHLVACESCRRELAGLRAMLSEAAGADVPEPSPFFWNQLSARVREGVAAVDDDAARMPAWRAWMHPPRVLVPAVAGALAVALAAVLLPRTPPPATIPSAPLPLAANATPPTVSPSMPPLAPLGAADDPQLSIVAAYATAVGWDDMRDEAAAAIAGSSDAVAGALTQDEQRELQRLLADEVAQARAQENRS